MFPSRKIGNKTIAGFLEDCRAALESDFLAAYSLALLDVIVVMDEALQRHAKRTVLPENLRQQADDGPEAERLAVGCVLIPGRSKEFFVGGE